MLNDTLATNTQAGLIALDTIKAIRTEFPEVHIMPALSKVSFGMPARTIINQTFLVLAIEAGMDCAVTDPTDKGLHSSITATEVVLGRDRYCMNFSRAFHDPPLDREDKSRWQTPILSGFSSSIKL